MAVAVGMTHCVVITEDGEVYSWGRNEHGQQGGGALSSKPEPTLMTLPEGRTVIGAACGPSQVGVGVGGDVGLTGVVSFAYLL